MVTPNLTGRDGGASGRGIDVAKAALTTTALTPDAILVPSQSLRLMQLMALEGQLTQPGMAQFVPLKSPTQQVNEVSLNTNGLWPVSEANALGDAHRTVPSFDKVEFSVVKYMAEILFDNEALEDSIERGDLLETILAMIAQRLMPWLEDIFINSDISTGATAQYQGLDGIISQAADHTLDALGAEVSPDLFEDTVLQLPKQYRKKTSNLAFITSPEADRRYKRALANRIGSVGDAYLLQVKDALYTGIPVVPVDYWPDKLGVGTNQTKILCTDPQNIQMGFYREFRMKSREEIYTDQLAVNVTVRADVKVAVSDATALTNNVLN